VGFGTPGLAVLTDLLDFHGGHKVNLYIGGIAVRHCQYVKFIHEASTFPITEMRFFGSHWLEVDDSQLPLPTWLPDAWPPSQNLRDLVLYSPGMPSGTYLSLFRSAVNCSRIEAEMSASDLLPNGQQFRLRIGFDVGLMSNAAYVTSRTNVVDLIKTHKVEHLVEVFDFERKPVET